MCSERYWAIEIGGPQSPCSWGHALRLLQDFHLRLLREMSSLSFRFQWTVDCATALGFEGDGRIQVAPPLSVSFMPSYKSLGLISFNKIPIGTRFWWHWKIFSSLSKAVSMMILMCGYFCFTTCVVSTRLGPVFQCPLKNNIDVVIFFELCQISLPFRAVCLMLTLFKKKEFSFMAWIRNELSSTMAILRDSGLAV